jgi:mannose-6-phosphate isomerase-like protein (cupin superfamily)
MRGGGGWDIAPVPAGGGGSSAAAVVSLGGDPGEPAHERRPSRLRCALPDLRVVEWRLRAPRSGLPSPRPERGVDAFFVIDGELEATVGETRRTAGEGSLITVPRGDAYALAPSGPSGARLLGLHTPVSPRL